MAFPSGEVAIVGVYESPRRKAPGVSPVRDPGGVHPRRARRRRAWSSATSTGSRPRRRSRPRAACRCRSARWPSTWRCTRAGSTPPTSAAPRSSPRRPRGARDRGRHGRRRGRLVRGRGLLGHPRDPVRRLRHQRAGPGQFEVPYGPSTVPRTRSPRRATCTSSARRPSSSRRSPCSAAPTPRRTRTRASATRSRSTTCSPRR